MNNWKRAAVTAALLLAAVTIAAPAAAHRPVDSGSLPVAVADGQDVATQPVTGEGEDTWDGDRLPLWAVEWLAEESPSTLPSTCRIHYDERDGDQAVITCDDGTVLKS